MELNKNEATTYQNMWNATRTMLRGKFIATNAFTGKK